MRRLFCTILTLALLVPTAAESARIRGTVRRARAVRTSETLGYTVTQVAASAKSVSERRADVVIFLRAKESKVIPKATEHPKVSIRGLRLVPEISACEVDGQILFLNEEEAPLTLMVGDDDLGALKPNEERTYTCTAIKGSAESELRAVRVKEWPHIRGAIHIGDLGVVATPDERGVFELNAPEGLYVLTIVGAMGALHERELEVKKSDIEVGAIDLRPEDQRNEPPPPVRTKPRPPPALDEEEEEGEDEGESP
jgi:hypothetical protein